MGRPKISRFYENLGALVIYWMVLGLLRLQALSQHFLSSVDIMGLKFE